MTIYTYDITVQDIYSTEDYGTISSSATLSDDFGVGSLSSTPTSYQDWYSINNSTTQIPFGSINISGTKSEASVKSNLVRGTFVTFGTAGKVQGSNWVGFGTVFEIGHGLDRTLRPYISSGTLRLGVYTIPKDVSFNSQIISFAEDNGITFDPYYVGLSSAIVSKTSSSPRNTQLFSISGTSVEKFAPNPPENTELFRISGAYTKLQKVNSWVGIGTIKVSGSAITKAQYRYVGIGTLFEVGIKSEKRTYVYDKTSILAFNTDDYGLISQVATVFEDFGQDGTLNTPANQSENWGAITNGLGVQITGALTPFGTSHFSGHGTESYVRSTYISSGQPPVRLYNSNTVSPNIKVIPHYGIEKNIGIGTTGIQFYGGYTNLKSTDSLVGLGTIKLSGGNIYSKVVKQPQSTQLFIISGRVVEKFASNPPENTQLFSISGAYSNLKSIKSSVGLGTIRLSSTKIEKRTNSYVGLGTGTFSGTKVEKFAPNPPENTELFIISGTVAEKFAPNPPENTELFVIYGDYNNLHSTKSYVGIGTLKLSGSKVEKFVTQGGESTQLFRISGSKIEKYSRASYKSILGVITLYNSNTVSPNIKIIPYYGIDKNIGIGTTGIQLSGSSINHSNRYPDPGGGLPVGSGIGTIRINDEKELTFYRANIPYYAKGGLINILGNGKESYTRARYIGLGTARISSVSSNRKIAVYTNVGFGTIRVLESNIPSIFKKTASYVGLSTILLGVGSTFDKKQIHSYRGSGTINKLSGSANSISRVSRTNTILYKFSGNGSESKVSNPPENTELFVISGSYSNLKKTKSYSGFGSIVISGSAKIKVGSTAPTTGLIKFITHTSDNAYDTVDSIVSVDYVNAAKVKFVANPPENTELFTISGSAITSKRSIRSYVGVAATIRLSGSATNIKKTKSYVGIGTIFEISSGRYKDISSYKGSGSITILSGSAKSLIKKPVNNTVLYNISGISSTKINHIVKISGIGTGHFGGSASIKKLSISSYRGIGTVHISGQLLYPNVKFIPSPKATGSITILGSATKSHSKPYKTSGSLFAFSGGFQSYTRKPYIGIGTIHISAISGITINNPYQIPRSYVIII